MDDMLICAASILEAIILSSLMAVLDQYGYHSKRGNAAFILIPAVAALLANYFDLPFHLALMTGLYILLGRLLTDHKLLTIIIDAMIAIFFYFAVQLIAAITIRLLWRPVTTNPEILLILRLLLAMAAVMLRQSLAVDYIMERYYRENRKLILWVAINLSILYFMVASMLEDKDNLSLRHIELLIVVLLFIVMNVGLIITMYSNMKKGKEIKDIKEYGSHLEELTEELNRREHEYKHQINALIGIAQYKPPEMAVKDIVEYSREILHVHQNKGRVSIVSENSNIAAFIYRQCGLAQNKQINFEYYIERPFPSYAIPDVKLIEILSNLVSNAFEAVEPLREKDRNVLLSCCSDVIEVINTVDESVSKKKVREFGRSGYSSKGAGHGYGIRNVLKITQKYNIRISYYLEDKHIVTTLEF